MTTTILHTADTHIGYRQYHKPEREEDFRNAFESVIDAAIEREVDAVVHAGDLFNRSRPSIEALLDCIEQLKRLRGNGIEFHTIVGNHDGTRTREWPEFFEQLSLGSYLGYERDYIGDSDVAVYGQDFVERGQREQVSYDFESPETETETETEATIFVGHGLFTPFAHGDWDMTEILAKSSISFDALLVGDNHKPLFDEIDGVPITYPGSTERTAADQTATRGYNIVEIENGDITITHESIETRQFQFIDVELSVGDTVETVVEEINSHEIVDGAVVVITLLGEGSRVSSGRIEDAGIQSGALVVRVTDRRTFEESEPEFQDVSFGDPDEAVRKRKGDLGLSSVGAEFETLARDIEDTPQSLLKETAEQRTSDILEEDGPASLRQTLVDTDGQEAHTRTSDSQPEHTETHTTDQTDAEAHSDTPDNSVPPETPSQQHDGTVTTLSEDPQRDEEATEQTDQATGEDDSEDETDEDTDDIASHKQIQFDELN